MDAKLHRHPNEASWFIISAMAGGAGWVAFVVFTVGIGLLIALPIIGLLWLAGMVFRAQLLGNCVVVGPRQHPQLDAMANELCAELEISRPTIFLMSGSGLLNAFALRLLGKGGSHVLLMAELVDLSLSRGRPEELKAILAHELAHHALGHVSPAKQALILPSRLISFLPQAYSRSCESSCDRVALALTQDTRAFQRSLLSLAGGSKALADQADIEAFMEQPARSGGFFQFLAVIQSTHPMLAIRVKDAGAYARELGLADAPA